MQTALLTTKLYFPPPRPALVPRQRLIEHLQNGLRGPLTLVSAPAGSGKTTLLSQWRFGPGADIPAVWLAFDSADNNLARFLRYISAALDPLHPGLAEEIRPLLQSSELPDHELILTILINHLSVLESAVVLVLDDIHLIETPEIHAALTFLLDHIPTNLHLVLLSRADPPLPLARLRARGQLIEIRGADLRFSEHEAAQFLNTVMGLDLNSEQIAALERRTEGWIAGLQLAALSMQDRDDREGFISAFTGSHHYILEYLVEEVLERQPEAIREFLLKTSILESLTGSLCDALTGQNNSSQVLEGLNHANLFVIPLDDVQHWYRYHHLFSEMLTLLLERNHPGLALELHRQASQWYENQGMLLQALDHAITAGDWPLVTQIISANVLVLVENDLVQPFVRKIDAVPQEKMNAIPWLDVARSWIWGIRQVPESLQLLDTAEQNINNVPDKLDRRRLTGHIAASRANLLTALGDYEHAVACIRLADELLPADEYVARILNIMNLGEIIGSGKKEYSSGIAILEQTLALAFKADKPQMIMMVTGSLANVNLFAGKLHELHRVCQQAITIAEKFQEQHQRPLPASAEVYVLLARCLAEWGENEQAIQIARKSVHLSKLTGRITLEALCLNYLGRILAFGNEWEQARQAFERVVSIGRWISAWYQHHTAVFALDSILDCDAPHSELNEYRHQVEETGIVVPHLIRSRLLLRDNFPEQALQALDQAESELREFPSFDIVRIYALRALAYQALQEDKQALDALQKALVLGEPENRMATFVREGADMERLLRHARAKMIEQSSSDVATFLHRILAAFKARRKQTPEPAPAKQALVESLSARELEVLKLLEQGCPDKQIAEILVIARETVHKHLKNIYSKLDVHNRASAVARARERNLL
jgi:LuxR family maltose regulon positive regulatory protein